MLLSLAGTKPNVEKALGEKMNSTCVFLKKDLRALRGSKNIDFSFLSFFYFTECINIKKNYR